MTLLKCVIFTSILQHDCLLWPHLWPAMKWSGTFMVTLKSAGLQAMPKKESKHPPRQRTLCRAMFRFIEECCEKRVHYSTQTWDWHWLPRLNSQRLWRIDNNGLQFTTRHQIDDGQHLIIMKHAPLQLKATFCYHHGWAGGKGLLMFILNSI